MSKFLIKLIDHPFEVAEVYISKNCHSNIKDIITNLAEKYFNSSKYAEAAKAYYHIYNLDKNNVETIIKLSTALYKIGNYAEALLHIKSGFKINNKNKEIIRIYLELLLLTGDANELEKISLSQLIIYPNNINYKLYLSNARRLLGDYVSASNILQDVIKNTKNPIYYLALADLIGETDSIKAIEIYKECFVNAQEIAPVNKFNLSIHYLRVRDFANAWPLYEYGLDKSIGNTGRGLPYNLKNFSRLSYKKYKNNEKILILPEQGVGDQIIFLSALNEFQKEYSNIYYVAENRFIPILTRSFTDVNFSSNGAFENFNIYQLGNEKPEYIPLGSLFSKYRNNRNDFLHNRKPFIKYDSLLHSQFKSILGDISNGRKVIGISWKSNAANNLKSIKNIDFIEWLPLFDNHTVIVNLQYGDTSEEENILQNLGLSMISFNQLDLKNDLDPLLALANACDGVISVSSSIVHLAAATGQKVAVVMPKEQGHWSLGLNDKESLIYQNVKIYRASEYITLTALLLDAANYIK
jgi:ADP-heptose:LPS heptosyltransferase